MCLLPDHDPRSNKSVQFRGDGGVKIPKISAPLPKEYRADPAIRKSQLETQLISASFLPIALETPLAGSAENLRNRSPL